MPPHQDYHCQHPETKDITFLIYFHRIRQLCIKQIIYQTIHNQVRIHIKNKYRNLLEKNRIHWYDTSNFQNLSRIGLEIKFYVHDLIERKSHDQEPT